VFQATTESQILRKTSRRQLDSLKGKEYAYTLKKESSTNLEICQNGGHVEITYDFHTLTSNVLHFLLVPADISPGTGPDDLQFLLLRFLMAYTAKAANAFEIITEQNYTRCPSCLPAGDVNLDTRPARITTGSSNSWKNISV
jgi:hypothetical protein